MFRTKIAVLFAALGLVLAACGGGAAETTTSEAQAPSTTGAPATTTAATTAAPTTTTAAPTTTTTGPSAATPELAAFREAVSESAQIESAQMEGSFSIIGAEGMPAGQEVAMTFSGAFDNRTGDFAMSIDLGAMLEAAAAAGEEIPPEMAQLFSAMEIRQLGDTAYMRFGFINLFLGVETEWLAIPAEEAGGVGDFTGGFVPTNPTEFLETFGAVDATIEEIGPETIRGADTIHYRVTVDGAALAAASGDESLPTLSPEELALLDELPLDFWIGKDGLLRKFDMTFDGSAIPAPTGQGFEKMVVSFEIFGFNEPVTIVAPDPADVTNVEDIDGGGIFGDFGGDT